MKEYYLAVDIGASSGRHILGWMENGKMQIEEVYRFPNQIVDRDGTLCWDMDVLFNEIKTGLKKCKEMGKIPVSMGIDTWGVDFVLLDKNHKVLGQTAAYRDGRTDGMAEEVEKIISSQELYQRTGIQKQSFNTIYQLMWIKKNRPKWMEKAETMLMIPDYFHYLLTGEKVQEYTNATTTQLVNPATGNWDYELIEMLGYKKTLFRDLTVPGSRVGNLTKAVQEEIGFQCKVILPPTHDTASAVVAVPAEQEDILYISSGTWSLMGTERKAADCGEESRKRNFTNEGGFRYQYRFLKNIMGLWMIQSLKREWDKRGQQVGFGEICARASKEKITSVVDCNDSIFLAPNSMTETVKAYCRKTGQQVPETLWELAAVVYNSLAVCYANCAKEIEMITGKKYKNIYIVGGGSNAGFLNQLTAAKTARRVFAGPKEATAIGNLAVQMTVQGIFSDIWQTRACIMHSFEINMYI